MQKETFNKKDLLRLLWLLPLPITVLLRELASRNPEFIEEHFSGGIFPAISSAVGGVFGIFPFSFFEFLVYAIAGGLLAWIVITIIKAVRKNLSFARLFRSIVCLGTIFSFGFCALYFMWGFNYFRLPLASVMALDVREREKEDLAELCELLVNTANFYRSDLSEDRNGVFKYAKSKTEVLAAIPSAYASLGESYRQFSREIPSAKPVLASRLMSRAGLSGIFIPFTEEANVNMDQSAIMLAASAAHESAHYLGIAREDEANFLGYLACAHSDDAEIRYSGTVLALVYATNALAAIDTGEFSRIRHMYSDGLKRDISAHNDYVESNKGSIAETTVSQINDSYLKSNKQDDGVMSYGRMVDLLLAYYEF